MGLFDFLKFKPKKPIDKGHVFYYHEDDFCRVEMRPRENLPELKKDLVQIENINQNHSDEYGYYKIHVIQEGKVKTIDRQIGIDEFENIMKKTGYKKFNNITTGYGSRVFDSEYSTGYGVRGCTLLFERHQNIVDHIWFDFYPLSTFKKDIDSMYTYVTEISKKWNLILVDWRNEIIVDPLINDSLRRYLNGEFEK